MHVIKQTDAQVTGKALVDEFEGGHALPNDPFLRTQVVGTDAALTFFLSAGFLRFSGDALE